MFEEGYYLSKDLDRIAFITASVTAFMVGVSWIIHGCNKCCGEDTDWRPACYGLCCRGRANCDEEDDRGGCKID